MKSPNGTKVRECPLIKANDLLSHMLMTFAIDRPFFHQTKVSFFMPESPCHTQHFDTQYCEKKLLQ